MARDTRCGAVDHFRAKLSSWKASTLSIGGRLTLIKSVLGTLGIYYLSIFKCPEYVLNSLEGGLNIGSLKAFNLASLQKWRWRLVNNPDSIWARVIVAIHGVEAGVDLKGCSCKGVWASIISTYSKLNNSNILPISALSRKVGNGFSIRFWKDHWNGELIILGFGIGRGKSRAPEMKMFFASLVSNLGQIQLLDEPDTWKWSIDVDESMYHVFFGCDLSSDIWHLVKRWTNLDLPTFSSWFSCLQWLEDWRVSRDVKDRADVIFVASLWCVWRYRNVTPTIDYYTTTAGSNNADKMRTKIDWRTRILTKKSNNYYVKEDMYRLFVLKRLRLL
ncbi:hypothetical protein Tco_0906097 [Tanacetum coccineum]